MSEDSSRYYLDDSIPLSTLRTSKLYQAHFSRNEVFFFSEAENGGGDFILNIINEGTNKVE